MSNPLDKISKEKLRDLLTRCWMTHDAMWFFHSLQEVGIDATNRINRAAVRDMAALEAQRLKKALGRADERLNDFSTLKTLFEEMFGVIKADFMKGSMEFTGENVLRLSWHQCFAFEGINRMGIIDHYQCGIFDRIDGWFNGLGLKFEVSPKVDGCMMAKEGKCYRDYSIFF